MPKDSRKVRYRKLTAMSKEFSRMNVSSGTSSITFKHTAVKKIADEKLEAKEKVDKTVSTIETVKKTIDEVFTAKQAAKEKNQQLEQPSKIKAVGEILTESKSAETDEQSYSGYLDLQNSTIKEERKMK